MDVKATQQPPVGADRGGERTPVAAAVVHGDGQIVEPAHHVGEILPPVRRSVYEDNRRAGSVWMMAHDVEAGRNHGGTIPTIA